MKILHLIHQYLPEHVGGTEFYTRWVAHRMVRRGHKVDIFYRRYAKGAGTDSHVDDDSVRVWSAWSGELSPNNRFMSTFKQKHVHRVFCRVVEQVQPDLIHIQHLMGLPVSIIDYVRQQGIPYIITLHDYWWICANAQLVTNYSRRLCDGPKAYLNCARCALARAGHPNLWPAIPPMAAPLMRRGRLLRQALMAAETLIAPSKFVSDWHAAHGIPAGKLQVIPHGLDSPPAQPRQARESGVPVRFAFIGGLSWQKGVHILLEAFSKIEAGAELWIAGDESAEPDYVSDLRQLATVNVRFLGKLPRKAVWDTLDQVDVVVVPSVWYETFSFIVSEAFAAGVPVVASRLGPLADRVRDGVDGLLVPPGDSQAMKNALLRFLQEPELLPQLQQGIPSVRTLDDHVAEVELVYQSVLLKK